MALTNVTFMVAVTSIRGKAIPTNESLEFMRKKTPFLHKQEKRNKSKRIEEIGRKQSVTPTRNFKTYTNVTIFSFYTQIVVSQSGKKIV